jgi:hypothetical protein
MPSIRTTIKSPIDSTHNTAFIETYHATLISAFGTTLHATI